MTDDHADLSEILAVFRKRGQEAWWLILACGHHYVWTGPVQPPAVGEFFKCSACNLPTVMV